jgi:hypothetical protein
MRIVLPAGVIALALTVLAGSEASACMLVPRSTVDSPMSWADRVRAERAMASSMTAARLRHAARNLAAGADPASGLAEMAVPNVRPIYIERSDCGPMNEIDRAEGEETREDLLAGTRFAGRGDEFNRMWRGFDGETFGSMCNAELRGRFAAFLRRRLSPQQLRDSYLFLAARWEGLLEGPGPLRRLTAFEGRERRPPLRWVTEEPWQAQEIRRWLRLVPAGRAMKTALDDFWRENEPLLGDEERICPAAVARRPEVQARIVALIEAELALQRR